MIGGGSPGQHCAGPLAEGGLRVALVERDVVMGPATMTFAREGTRVTGFTIDAGRARGLRFVRR